MKKRRTTTSGLSRPWNVSILTVLWCTIVLNHYSTTSNGCWAHSYVTAAAETTSLASSTHTQQVSRPPRHALLQRLWPHTAAASKPRTTCRPKWLPQPATPPPSTNTGEDSSTALSSSASDSSVTNTEADEEPRVLSYNASATDAGSLELTDLWSLLQSSPSQGLTSDEAARRLQLFGPNVLAQPPSKSLWQLVLEQFEDRLVQILLGVAVLSALFSVWEVSQQQHGGASSEALWKSFVEPAVILAILVVNAIVGVVQSQSAADSLQALQTMQAGTATVLRDSLVQTCASADLVPGDVVVVKVGDKVPADARLIATQGANLQLDEASLTGESVTVPKLPNHVSTIPNAPIADQKGLLFSGTMVTAGSGTAVVVQTGMDTQFGKIQQGVTAAQAEAVKTPLAARLDEFGNQLTVIIAAICALVWIVSIPKMQDSSFDGNLWEGALYYAKVAVALGVAAIPEGLPAVITLCLSLGTRKMAERNVLVRKLPSVETLGCTTVICTDKTGTLTTNEMTAVSLVLLEPVPVVPENDNQDEQKRRKRQRRRSPHRMTEDDHHKDLVMIEHGIQGSSYSPLGDIEGIAKDVEIQLNPRGALADVAAVSALCNDAQIVGNSPETKNDDHDEEQEHKKKKKESSTSRSKKALEKREKLFERIGEPTEAALCVLAEKIGGLTDTTTLDQEEADEDNEPSTETIPMDPATVANANVNLWRERRPRTATLEFSRDRKSMSVLCQFPWSMELDKPAEELSRALVPLNTGRPKTPPPTRRRRKRKESTPFSSRLLVKGAPNLLIERCTHIKQRDGTVVRLSGALRRKVEAKVSEMAARPLRCLALAVKEHDDLEDSLQTLDSSTDMDDHPLLSRPENFRHIESRLTLVGIVGIKDPARPEVAQSIQLCSQAGIRVIMITGDARDTAVAIAKDVNIFAATADASTLKAFEGREFFQKPEEEQLELLKRDNLVFCRAEPADKQKLVKMLQSLHEVPAMTGDGVNDAPALQQAAIGVAMGITGTEVSKEAADMVLADDNFSTIVNAVEEGRRIYANMQAFICFLISCNIGEICAIFFATLAGFPEPLTAMHLLWVNLVTDGPPATALGFNPPSPDLMEQPPRPSDEPIMTRWLLTRYCLTGLYVGLATIGVYAQHYLSQGISLHQIASWSQCGEFWQPPSGSGLSCTELFQGQGRMIPQTLSLTTLVCMEMLKALSAVSVDSSLLRVGPQSNPWLLLGVAGPLLLHLFVLYSPNIGLPALAESLGMVPLSGSQWWTVAAWALPILLVDEVLKAIGRWLYSNRKERTSATKAVA